MSIHQKLTGVAVTEMGWIAWLVMGLAMGGVALMLQRALYLVSVSDRFLTLKSRAGQRVGRLLRAATRGTSPAASI